MTLTIHINHQLYRNPNLDTAPFTFYFRLYFLRSSNNGVINNAPTLSTMAYNPDNLESQLIHVFSPSGHRLTSYKIVGHFFGRHIGKYRGLIRSKIVFFRISNISAPCPHAQLRGRTVIKKLWAFFGLWSRECSRSPPCQIFRVKQIHQSTASKRTTRLSRPQPFSAR